MEFEEYKERQSRLTPFTQICTPKNPIPKTPDPDCCSYGALLELLVLLELLLHPSFLYPILMVRLSLL
jgi:hypothetical protein